MEGFKPEEKKLENICFPKHRSYFSPKNLNKIIGNSLVITGGVFVLAGIYGQIGETSFIHDSRDSIPTIINHIIDYLDSMSVTRKTGGGAAMTGAGFLTLTGYFDALWKKSADKNK